MEALQSFVRACGGHESLLDGWTAKTETRQQGSSAGTTDTYFFAPSGKRFRSRVEIARAVLHCTVGDGVLGAAALGAALLLTRARGWPAERFGRVALVATLLGVAATAAIEWLAVEVQGRWAYAPAMPRLPPLGTGLTPVLQWTVLPPLCLLAARYLAAVQRRTSPGGLP